MRLQHRDSLSNAEKLQHCYNVMSTGGICQMAGELAGIAINCDICPIPDNINGNCAPLKVVKRAQRYIKDHPLQDEDNVI
jgi:hypothetical protein